MFILYCLKSSVVLLTTNLFTPVIIWLNLPAKPCFPSSRTPEIFEPVPVYCMESLSPFSVHMRLRASLRSRDCACTSKNWACGSVCRMFLTSWSRTYPSKRNEMWAYVRLVRSRQSRQFVLTTPPWKKDLFVSVLWMNKWSESRLGLITLRRPSI